MRIYLDNRLLVQSRIFSEEEKWKRAEQEEGKRDWLVYTWNSGGRLTAGEDGTSREDSHTIEARLDSYKVYERNDEFRGMMMAPPDHEILISSFNGFIHTSFNKIKELVGVLERHGIDCLVSSHVAPLSQHITYESPRLKEQRENPIEVKL